MSGMTEVEHLRSQERNLTELFHKEIDKTEKLSAELIEVYEENESLGRALEQAAAKNDELARKLAEAEGTLTELKKLVLIGPLTAEEWLEFRLRREEDEDHELLRCCANTSAIRDDIFHLMRSYAEDPLLGAGPIIRIREAIVDHGQLLDPGHPAGRRLAELLDKMSDYYRRELV